MVIDIMTITKTKARTTDVTKTRTMTFYEIFFTSVTGIMDNAIILKGCLIY